MHKFDVTYLNFDETKFDTTLPSLFKIYFGEMYFIHKGRDFRASVNKYLEDIFRGTKGGAVSDANAKAVKYLRTYPSLYKVSVELLLNDEPEKVLKMEDRVFNKAKKDPKSLHDPLIAPYKPNWMLRQVFGTKCVKCITHAVVDGAKIKANFCMICGRAVVNTKVVDGKPQLQSQ